MDRIAPGPIREGRDIVANMEGSKTEKNILTAFAGESQARNRYTYFAEAARDEGYEQIAGIFLETADHERAHARRLFGLLEGGEVEIGAAFPAGVIGTTAENLRAGIEGEHYENSEMYPGFAQVARDEGFTNVAAVFEAIAVSETQHEKRYRELLANVEAEEVFVKSEPVTWKCRNCGYLHVGTEAPRVCAACAYPKKYFEILAENW